MTPCRLSLDADSLCEPQAWIVPRNARAPGWTRKTFALGLHAASLALFGLTVVWPVVGPLASGEMARDFGLLQSALEEWLKAAVSAPWLPPPR
ncbi:MAG TPA: hypothetical protein VNB23_17375 [Ramlibacter sp.]|nr:hypothetical protein [Ramlibacter sp.]